MGERPQLHISSVNMLSFCGEQFRRRYIEGEVVAPGVAAIVGKATDRSVTINLQHKIETSEALPIDAVMANARDAFEHEWEREGVRLSEDEIAAGVAIIRGAAIDKAVRLARLHAEHVAPSIQPTHVARPLVVTVEGYDYDLAMELDVQERSRIRDTKTSAKTPGADVAHDSDQLTMYALGVRVIDGTAPDEVVLDYLIDNKTPVAKQFASTRDEDDFRVLLNRLEAAITTISRGAFMPAKRSEPLCSPKFCGYFSTCRYVRNPKSIAITGKEAA